MNKQVLSIGELLWDLLPDRTILGGAPSNLAYRLVEMGNDCRIISRVGTDELGQRALSTVQSLGLSTAYIQRDPLHGTGTVDVTFDKEMNPDYIINRGAAYDFIESTPALLEAAENCSYLVYGTLAQRTPVTRDSISRLIERAPAARKFLDVNLRKDCYSEPVLDGSLRSADILKTNHHEIRDIFGILGITPKRGWDLPELTQSLAEAFGIRTILVTMEEFGAFLCDPEEGTHYLPGYKVRLEDPLGAGDGFSAAFIHHSLKGATLKEACRQGNILGAAVATTRGATQPINEEFISRTIDEDRLNIHQSLKKYL